MSPEEELVTLYFLSGVLPSQVNDMVFQVRLVLEYVRAGKINLTPDCLECSHI